MVFTLKWGIMATGNIAGQFVTDLLIDPATRNASDINHVVTAVSASRSLEKAVAFISRVTKGTKQEADADKIKAYADFQALANDGNVDIIYIATPQSEHYRNILMSLEAGKHVCCEIVTINAAQTSHVIQVAKSKNLFLMEALWTRFFPLTRELKKLLHEDKILGSISRVIADFSIPVVSLNHRLHDPMLGGGALLDLGIYPLQWVYLILFDHPENDQQRPKINAAMLMSDISNVDEHTTVALTFEKVRASGIIGTSISSKTPSPYSVAIIGEKVLIFIPQQVHVLKSRQGEILLPWAPSNPASFTIRLHGEEPQTRAHPQPGGAHGLCWQADECARAIRDGKSETAQWTLGQSLELMQVMDEIRKQGGLKYPDPLENCDLV